MSLSSPTSSIPRRLFQLAWPIIGLNVLNVLALALDTVMVGHGPGAQDALTGMGYAAQLIFLLMVAMIGLTVSTVAFIARATGAMDPARASHVLQQASQLTLVLGVLVAVVGNLMAVPLLMALGAEASSMDAALAYLRPLLLGSAFSYLNILFAAALRGVGDTRLAFAVALVLNGLNVVFNYGLILGNFGLPAMGIAGAAIGTVLAQACAVALMAVLIHQGAIKGLRLRYRPTPVDMPLARDLLRIGWPAAADMLVLNAGFLTILGLLGRLDQAAVAAHGIGLRVQALAFVPGMSIGQAVGAMVGQALGADDVHTARRVVWSGVWMNTAIMTSLGMVLLVLAHPIVGLFGVASGTPLRLYSVQWMELLGYSMPLVGAYIAFAGLLSGAGDTRASLRINATVTLGAQIPASYVLGFVLGWGTWGVWAAFPITFGIKLVWAYWEYRRERWVVAIAGR